MGTKFKKGDAVTFECAGRKTSGMVECTMREGTYRVNSHGMYVEVSEDALTLKGDTKKSEEKVAEKPTEKRKYRTRGKIG